MLAKHLQLLNELNEKLIEHSFLTDPDTIGFLKKSKILFINRGIPGSGKSTLAARIVQIYPESKVCEGDKFFTDEFGNYKFNRDKIDECRMYLQHEVRSACKLGKRCVIADDTHLSYQEIEPLIHIGKEFNYFILLIEPRSTHKFDVNKLHVLCQHDISKETIQKKLDAFELIVPRFYGWFLNQTDSLLVCNLAKKCFQDCLKIQNLTDHFKKIKNSIVFEELFETRNQYQLHCTAKFLDRKNDILDDYLFDVEVNQSVGKMFPIEVVGFCITERCIVADVRLSNVGNLWQNDLNKEEIKEVLERKKIIDEKIELEKLNYGHKAHLTIALEPSLRANKTGIDLIFIKLLKINKDYINLQNDNYDLFYFGQCLCYAKLKKIIKISSLFAAQF